MKKTNGLRTIIRMALRYRRPLVASMVCSVLVGVLWGANIGTLYPFMSVVLNGQSFNDLLASKSADASRRCAELRRELRAARESGEATANHSQLEAELALHEQSLAFYQRLEPWAQQYLPGDAFASLALIVSVLLIGTAIKGLCFVGSEALVARVVHRTIFDLRLEFYRRTLRLDLQTFSEDRRSKLLSYFTHHLRLVQQGLGNLLGQSVREPVKILACLIGAAIISWRLLLAALLIAPLGVILTQLTWRTVRKHDGEAMSAMSELYHRLSESFAGIRVVKAFNMEYRERAKVFDTSKSLLKRLSRTALARATIKPLTEFVSMVGVFLAILLGSYLVLRQETHVFGIRLSSQPLSITALLVFYGMLLGISDPLRKLSTFVLEFRRCILAADKVVGVMNRQPSIIDPANPQPLPERVTSVAFQDVSFRYGSNRNALKNVKLQASKNETIVIVGPNGCGKSTLLNLLLRLYDPRRGMIQIGEVDLRDASLRDLRERIALVPQDSPLFDDTVYNNIRYGCPAATQEEVEQAAKLAQAHRFIKRDLADGYETVIGEGGEFLSGGQRQRLALARAILRDPEILILDESTSEIDVETDRRIFRSLRPFLKNRLTFIVTHRPSALRIADRIVVMESGRIQDVGTHSELRSRNTFYRVLCRARPRQRRRSA